MSSIYYPIGFSLKSLVLKKNVYFELQGVLSSCFLIFFSCFYMLILVLWNVYGECENFSTLKGHAGAIMDLHFSTDGR